MEQLQQLMDDIQEWSDTTFGNGQRTVSILHHLKKEVPELIEAMNKEIAAGVDDSIGVGEYSRMCKKTKLEFADCLMLILDAASHNDMSADDLLEITRAKLIINKQRKWGKPDKNGVVEHIRN